MSKKRMVAGVGVNDADYPTTISAPRYGGKQKRLWTCPFYRSWADMITRCYNAKHIARRPTYADCSVTQEWHRFSAFRAWMVTQEWEGKQLDKDILFEGNKVYSPDTCVFVSAQLNSFLIDQCSVRGTQSGGFYWHKEANKFSVGCHNPFTRKNEYIGLFDCPDAAHQAWRSRKHEFACAYADQQIDPRIAKALRERFATTSNNGESNVQNAL